MKLIKDSIWNVLSIGIPALVAIPIFSLISKKVGFEIFGIYTLSFAIVGYASIFDLGLSRAVIREVAIHVNHPNDINYIVNTAFSVVVILGLLSCLIILLTNSFLVDFIGVSLYFKADVIKGIGVCQHSCHPNLNQATKTSVGITRLDRRTGLSAVG